MDTNTIEGKAYLKQNQFLIRCKKHVIQENWAISINNRTSFQKLSVELKRIAFIYRAKGGNDMDRNPDNSSYLVGIGNLHSDPGS